ncbi:PREDICTED: MATE efflux family protein 4, chloroplastic-like [Populus euphratica]|uniref:Protein DETOXIFICATION n=1 Tax=Populus euphratica TaxID=75702 RepID=A0AAJ6VHB1_POPEU|nr:PREDICTED: MATE efflux family protein 4, chloroplastic-like [Populus euphratica]
MQARTLLHCSHTPLQNHKYPRFLSRSLISFKKRPLSLVSPNSHISHLHPIPLVIKPRSRLLPPCNSPAHESANSSVTENESSTDSISEFIEETGIEMNREGLENQSMWEQMKEIVMFTGPATGLWICGPLMSLIDTAVIGQGSSIELAALGPGTVLCDGMSYIFMFLSIATSNMVATSLAKQDKNEVQHQLSMLLFIGLTCGSLMFLFTKFFGPSALKAFAGSDNLDIIPAANTYVQIRGLAWPAILIGWVVQSASLGMKDSWGPLKALAVASAVNGIGDIVLCRFLGYGIAGAAWATMASQIVAAFMMINSLNKKGYNAYAMSVPSTDDLMIVFRLAAPAFIMMISKVAFYSLIVYFVTSMDTVTLAAHQVMIQAFFMCTVWGEPLSQAAQSFMPELMYGVNRSLEKARTMLKSLVIIGTILGLALGIIGTSVPWFFPSIFTHDQKIIQEMHKVLIPYFLALAVTPCILSLEGTLLAGRDLKFISLAMSGCSFTGALLLLLVSSRGYGLPGYWFALVGFQWGRFFLALQRLLSPDGILFSEDLSQHELKELKAA